MTYSHCGLVEDLRELDLPPINLVLQDLRKKIYGVLLFERPGDLEPVVEMVVDSVDNFEPKYVYPVFPKAHHPGLLALWSELNYDSIKWNLLADLFNVDSEKLKTIPRKLLVPALSMKYLADRVMLEEWEVIAIVLSAVVTSLSTLDELRAVSVSWFQSRPIRLYSLVTTTYGALHFSLLALNGPISCSEYVPQNYQYGTVFHIIYKMLRFGMKPAYIVKTGFNMKEHVICEAQTRLIFNFVTAKN